MTDKLSTSRTPTLTEILRKVMSQVGDQLYTAMPGKIESYDSVTQSADVMPLLSKVEVDQDGNEESFELPILPKVPVVFPRGGGFFLSFPLHRGDNVLLIFCDRSIDDFWFSDGLRSMDQNDFRSHDISDAVAIPGFFPQSRSILDASSTDLIMGKDQQGKQISVTSTNEIKITSRAQNVLTLDLEGSLTTMEVGDGAKHVAIVEALQSLWTKMKTTLDTWGNTHVHPTGVGPSGVAAPPLSSDAWDPNINSSKVSIPDG